MSEIRQGQVYWLDFGPAVRHPCVVVQNDVFNRSAIATTVLCIPAFYFLVAWLFPGDRVDVLECKWNPQDFDPAALKAFRALHPGGRNYVISPVAGDGFVRRLAGLEFTVCDPTAWAARAHISA